MEFNVLVWNIMIPVLPPLRYFGQYERAERIPNVIETINNSERNLDAIVFNELIPQTIYNTLNAKMHELGFIYTTNRLTDILTESGGVSIYSRHPIVDQTFTLFGSECAISDCLSAKGVVYAKINKDGFYMNMFATHFQAGAPYFAIRESQLQMTKKFMDQVNIPQSEAVGFFGDVNTDYYLGKSEMRHMAHTLKMKIPEIAPKSHVFTFDPAINALVGADDPEEYKSKDYPNGCVSEYMSTKVCVCCEPQWLDYAMTSTNHLQPLASSMTSLLAKTQKFNMGFTVSDSIDSEFVSDHFPVLAHFEFPIVLDNAQSTRTQDVDTNSNVSQASLFIVLILTLVGIVILIMVYPIYYIYKRKRSYLAPLSVGATQ